MVAGGLVAVCLITVLMWLVGCWYCCCGVVEGPTGDVVALWLQRRWRRREKRLKRLRREGVKWNFQLKNMFSQQLNH